MLCYAQIVSGLRSDAVSSGLRPDAGDRVPVSSGLRSDAVSSRHRSDAEGKALVSSGLRSNAVSGLWSDAVGKAQAKLTTVLTVCIILHNMIIEEEGETIYTNTNRHPVVLHKVLEIQNLETHHNLRHDLAEHIWERQFEGQNNNDKEEDENGDDEKDNDGDDEEDKYDNNDE
uniref:Uncharacterized protein n=1 Tax=Lactuca sativa TaxID=4236 RepID=A0A9R1V179_LACSA|nr:hypothetical protein LSAT_V11C700385760 [Lactuca sativa]